MRGRFESDYEERIAALVSDMGKQIAATMEGN